MLVSIILPTYCEGENLKVLIPQICKSTEKYDIEVVVVDDNSPDQTKEVIHELSRLGLPVRLITRTKDRGFANSIREGIEQTESEYVLVMDSDGNHSSRYLPFMIENIKFYDCVSASRFQYGGGMNSKSRLFLSFLFNTFVRISTGGFITDSLYGFFIIKRDRLDSVEFDKVFWGYGDYCIRLFFYLQKSGVGILQFPAKNGKRVHGKGNSRFIRVFIQYFSATLKLVVKERVFNGK